jgi:hypothetical protein
MNRRSFRYRIVDLAELLLEDAELTVQVQAGETIRVGDGTLMVVTEVVETPADAAYAGVLIVEPGKTNRHPALSPRTSALAATRPARGVRAIGLIRLPRY